MFVRKISLVHLLNLLSPFFSSLVNMWRRKPQSKEETGKMFPRVLRYHLPTFYTSRYFSFLDSGVRDEEVDLSGAA